MACFRESLVLVTRKTWLLCTVHQTMVEKMDEQGPSLRCRRFDHNQSTSSALEVTSDCPSTSPSTKDDEDAELLHRAAKLRAVKFFLRFEPVVEQAYDAWRAETRLQGVRVLGAVVALLSLILVCAVESGLWKLEQMPWYKFYASPTFRMPMISVTRGLFLGGVSMISCRVQMKWLIQTAVLLGTIMRIFLRERSLQSTCANGPVTGHTCIMIDSADAGMKLATIPLLFYALAKICLDVPAWLCTVAMLLFTVAGAHSTNACLRDGSQDPFVWTTLTVVLAVVWYAEISARLSFSAVLKNIELKLHVQEKEKKAATQELAAQLACEELQNAQLKLRQQEHAAKERLAAEHRAVEAHQTLQLKLQQQEDAATTERLAAEHRVAEEKFKAQLAQQEAANKAHVAVLHTLNHELKGATLIYNLES